ncbi:MAG: polysaccharide biosynthesis tyrosine autokinase [Bacteroidaceae bacterium]|nr:polysaccharide biosynthesis tyrosine autokinase [Bacteroidaceae bacterium]
MSTENPRTTTENEEGFDLKELLSKLIINWRWFVLSLIICLFAAAMYLRYKTEVYSVQATVQINDEKKGSYQNQMMALQDFGLASNTGGIDNEIEIMRSKSLVKEVVKDLKLYTIYTIHGRVQENVIYGKYPVEVNISEEDLENLTSGTMLTITQPTEDTYKVSYKLRNPETRKIVETEEKIDSLPYIIESPIGQLILTKGEGSPLPSNLKMTVSIVPPIRMAKRCLAGLSIAPTSKTTSIAHISYQDVNKRRGVDFVNQLVDVYNRENNNDKNVVGYKTEQFINERLSKVAEELNATESQLAGFKSSSGLTDLSSNAQLVIQSSNEYEKKRAELQAQLSILTQLKQYVNNPANHLQVIPGNVGLTDATLTALIGQYNEAIVKRSNLLRTATESNSSVIEVTSNAEQLANAIKTSIESLNNALNIQVRNADSQASRYNARINQAPTQEKELAKFTRQREVQQELYIMLLQKREENSLALAATADNAKIIDAALANDAPVSPKRSMIWLLALILGLAIPIGLIYLMELLRYRIEGRNDLDKLTSVPILGDIALDHTLKTNQRAIVIKENENDTMAETFRAIRTNLQFLLDSPDKKVTLFTSTTSGEGKTFVASNLAMSFALLGKKVILLGLDIRKPRLAEMFGIKDHTKGITSFLVGDKNDKELLFEQISKTEQNENLDILPAGIIPPNPAELLSKENLDKAIEYLKEKYDFIILDTAPIGLVTDTQIISRVADACIYVTRADYTTKNDILFLNDIYKEGKLKNMSIVLNGVDMNKRKYGYYYGYGKYGKYGQYGRYGYGKYGKYGQYGYQHDK